MSQRIKLTTRLCVLYCYVWSVLLYGCETWTISETMKERLRSVEMWFFEKDAENFVDGEKEYLSNPEVLRAAGVQRTLMKTIRQRQLDFFGHVMRKQGI